MVSAVISAYDGLSADSALAPFDSVADGHVFSETSTNSEMAV